MKTRINFKYKHIVILECANCGCEVIDGKFCNECGFEIDWDEGEKLFRKRLGCYSYNHDTDRCMDDNTYCRGLPCRFYTGKDGAVCLNCSGHFNMHNEHYTCEIPKGWELFKCDKVGSDETV